MVALRDPRSHFCSDREILKSKDRGEEIREVQRYGVVLLKKLDETPIDANDISANTSATLVMEKTLDIFGFKKKMP